MSLFGGILGAVGGLLGFAGQESANNAQADMLERQIEWQREVLQNRVQWNVEDMEAAGMNPVLSVMGSGGASGSAPSVSAPQVGNTGAAAVSSAAGLASIINQFRQTENETRKVDSEVQVNSARADHEQQNANFQRALLMVGFPQSQDALAVASAKQAIAQAALLFDKRDEVKQSIIKIQHEVKNLEAQRSLIIASVQEAKTAAARNATQAELAKLDGKLRQAQRDTEALRAEGLEIENELKSFGRNEAKAGSDWWQSFLNNDGQYIPRPYDYQYIIGPYRRPKGFRAPFIGGNF